MSQTFSDKTSRLFQILNNDELVEAIANKLTFEQIKCLVKEVKEVAEVNMERQIAEVFKRNTTQRDQLTAFRLIADRLEEK